MTSYFIEILRGELEDFDLIKDEVVQEFSLQDYAKIVDGWTDKIKRCTDGDQAWGYFKAKKQYA